MPLDNTRIHDVPDDLLAAIDYCFRARLDGRPAGRPAERRASRGDVTI